MFHIINTPIVRDEGAVIIIMLSYNIIVKLTV